MAFWSTRRRKRPTSSPPPTGDSMDVVRRTSSLPSGVFKAIDPNVEDALNGPVADVFLTHMTAPGVAATQENAEFVAPQDPRNRVDVEEINAFMSSYTNAEPAAVPKLRHGLGCERMWVLTDLATNGSGRARELATRELRTMVADMGHSEDFDINVLQNLIDVIEPIEASDGATVLLQVLLSSARKAIRQLAGDAS